ncbi:MAG: diaminopimelate epimerase [Bradymonadaceae bacterium]|nr:diaminopimelate epimerase [Lujinxingiaceae bacterium]
MAASQTTFYKYHGTRNDFVVIEAGAYGVDAASVSQLCARHQGVGADGILFYTLGGPNAGFDARMVIYNQDGSRPQMCGNGVRCLARHLVEVLAMASPLVIMSDAGARRCEVSPGQVSQPWEVAVEMGKPRYSLGAEALAFEGRSFRWHEVNMGNPHAVIFEGADEAFADRLGALANAGHPFFEEGVNVEFVELVGDNHLRVLVYERGVGRTQACGTGACAAAVAAWKEGLCELGQPVRVDLPGGSLVIEQRGVELWMSGPAVAVFSGKLAADWPPAASEL